MYLDAMDMLTALFVGEPPALTLPGPGSTRRTLPVAEVASLAQHAPLPPPRRKVLEGLALLWHDRWEQAHAVAQSHEGQPDYDLLHAIGHRREGDYPNADYWFRSAGRHPALAALSTAAGDLLAGDVDLGESLLPGKTWSSKAFTAEVRQEAGRGGARRDVLVRLQALEFRGFAEWLLSA